MAAGENIYGFSRKSIEDEFAERIESLGQGLMLTVYTDALTDGARNALEKSYAAIGYEGKDCAFADISGMDAAGVFRLIEGMDPLCLVATDADAALLCAQATRKEFPLMQATRLFGREARAIPALNDQLSDAAGKQAVWRLLKSLG